MRKYAAALLAVLLVVVGLAFVGCTNPASPLADDSAAVARGVRGHGQHKVTVRPSGDLSGAEDRLAIQTALETCRPGGVVELKKGHFYIDRPVVVEGFKGTFRGAGMDRTTVENAEGFEAVELRCLGNKPMGILFGFFWPKDYVTVEDMTLEISGPNPCKEYPSIFLGFLPSRIMSNHLVIGAVADGCDSLTATCRSIRTTAAPSNDPNAVKGMNVMAPIAFGGGAPSPLISLGGLQTFEPINAKVENCHLEGSGGPAVLYYQGCEGSAEIRHNTFVDCWVGVSLEEKNQGCDILVTGNEFRGTMGGNPIQVFAESSARIVCNDYDDLASSSGGYAVMLLGGGNEVYEDLTGRPDLSVFDGDPSTNTIVTDYCRERGHPRRK